MTTPKDFISASMLVGLFAICCLSAVANGQPPDPESQLRAHTNEFRPEVIRVTNDVYVASGYGGSNSAMIIGETGLIIIDTRESISAARAVWEEFRGISSKPLAAVIYTHGHGDHTNGTRVFTEGNSVPIYARSNFRREQLNSAALSPISFQRTARQFGIALQPGTERINIGLAEYVWMDREGDGHIPPTMTFEEERIAVEIAGINLELVAAPGETNDQLYVWYPEQSVLFPGDNFYKAFPNLYPIRGSSYRDVLLWSGSLEKMRTEGPEFLVPSHSRPIVGAENVDEALADYSTAIRYIHDQTIEGMNQGQTPDQLVRSIRLPADLADSPYLQEFYGTVAWSIRAIFDGYIGWFDGNPTNLFPLSSQDEANRIVELAGGADNVNDELQEAVANGDFQWALQLADHLLAIDYQTRDVTQIKISALGSLAALQINATARNYYLSFANELSATLSDTASEASANEAAAKGVVSRLNLGDVSIHSFTAPEDSELVNSHIIETANSLVVFDMQFHRPYARQLRSYVDELGKPVDRIILTHQHPDHWFGFEAFDGIPIYAHQEVADGVRRSADFYIEARRQQLGELVPETARLPDQALTNAATIDGLRYEFDLVENAEASVQTVAILPDYNVLIAGDLLSNNAHSFYGGGYVESWAENLRVMADDSSYEYIFVGHGLPPVINHDSFAWQISYLETSAEALKAPGPQETFEAMEVAYPDLGAEGLSRMTSRFFHSVVKPRLEQ